MRSQGGLRRSGPLFLALTALVLLTLSPLPLLDTSEPLTTSASTGTSLEMTEADSSSDTPDLLAATFAVEPPNPGSTVRDGRLPPLPRLPCPLPTSRDPPESA